MSDNQITLGQAIDKILAALNSLDDGARRTALTAVCMQLDIVFSDLRTPSGNPGYGAGAQSSLYSDVASDSAQPASVQHGRQIDIRSLKEQKKPSSARQMACVVGFYVQELAPPLERKDTINVNDLERYFKQAGFKLPTKLAQLLLDCKAAGYFENPTRGEYKLTAVGYNLVAHNLAGNFD